MRLNSLLLVLLLLGGCASHSPAPSKPAVAEEYITALKETQKEFAKYKVPGLKSVKDCTQDKCPADKGIWMNQDDFDKWDDAIDDLLHGKETYEHVIDLKDRKINQMVDGWSQTDIALKKAEAEAKKLEEQREHEERWRFVKDSFYNILIGTMSHNQLHQVINLSLTSPCKRCCEATWTLRCGTALTTLIRLWSAKSIWRASA